MQKIYAIEIACFVLLVSLFVPQLIQADLRADLIAHWEFDEGKR